MYPSLASVAQHEFNALAQDTKSAIHSLKRQRESVMQAIKAAHRANGRPGRSPDETDLLLSDLLDRMNRLSAALDQVICEIEHVQAGPASASGKAFIVMPLPLKHVADDKRQVSRDGPCT
jgi:hypothetical protein